MRNENLGIKPVKKWLRASRERQARRMMPKNWNCSQIENEEEEEEDDWQKENQMAVQWDEDEKSEKTLERRRMEGSSLQVEVMHKVPELLVVRESGRDGSMLEEFG